MRCLIVDDSPEKASQISELLGREFGDGAVRIELAGSVYEAGQRMREYAYDLLLVDLNLPIRAGSPPVPDGGAKLLRQVMRATGDLKRPLFIVGVTAFEELAEKDLKDFSSQGWAIVHYDAASSSWESTIANHCRQISAIQGRYRYSNEPNVDVCICTALAEPELKACKDLLGSRVDSQNRFGRTFDIYEISAGGRSVTCALASATEMGIAGISSLATQMVCGLRPRIFFLTGICAGIKSEIGDIVIAESTLNYETGKYKQAEESIEVVFNPEPRYLNCTPRLLDALRTFSSERRADILGLPARFPGANAPKAPNVAIGPVACGAAVIESSAIIENLQFQNRKLEGLEMESYGFYLACRNAHPGVEYAMVKAVCDTGRPPKEDRYQAYASFLGSCFTIEFIKDLIARNSLLLGNA